MDEQRILEVLSGIRSEIAKVAAMVEERNTAALLWRADVCKKFDKIFVWLESLPCKERKLNTKLVWGAIGIIGGILVAHLGWK